MGLPALWITRGVGAPAIFAPPVSCAATGRSAIALIRGATTWQAARSLFTEGLPNRRLCQRYRFVNELEYLFVYITAKDSTPSQRDKWLMEVLMRAEICGPEGCADFGREGGLQRSAGRGEPGTYQLPRSPNMSITWPSRSAPLSQLCFSPASTSSGAPFSTPAMMAWCSSIDM